MGLQLIQHQGKFDWSGEKNLNKTLFIKIAYFILVVNAYSNLCVVICCTDAQHYSYLNNDVYVINEHSTISNSFVDKCSHRLHFHPGRKTTI